VRVSLRLFPGIADLINSQSLNPMSTAISSRPTAVRIFAALH
jgi:hypothetical protein